MNFYDLIAKFKYICNNELEQNRTDSNELTKAINQAQSYISYLNSKYHISPYIAGCAGIGLLFCALFTYAFESIIWLALAILGGLLTTLGYYQEKKQDEFKSNKQMWYKYCTDLNMELNQVRIEEQHLKSLLNDVQTCCNYYIYLVDEVSKSLPIDIDLQEVLESGCLLSTYLDKFYTGNLEEFRKLANCDKKTKEKTNRIYERINQVRYPNGEQPQLSIHRRRRTQQVEEEQPKVLQYPTNLKRRA